MAEERRSIRVWRSGYGTQEERRAAARLQTRRRPAQDRCRSGLDLDLSLAPWPARRQFSHSSAPWPWPVACRPFATRTAPTLALVPSDRRRGLTGPAALPTAAPSSPPRSRRLPRGCCQPSNLSRLLTAELGGVKDVVGDRVQGCRDSDRDRRCSIAHDGAGENGGTR